MTIVVSETDALVEMCDLEIRDFRDKLNRVKRVMNRLDEEGLELLLDRLAAAKAALEGD